MLTPLKLQLMLIETPSNVQTELLYQQFKDFNQHQMKLVEHERGNVKRTLTFEARLVTVL